MASRKQRPNGRKVFCWSIRTRSGKVIRPKNGRPFCFYVKEDRV